MTQTLEHIKATFRSGRRQEALAACHAVIDSTPEHIDALRLAALMHGMLDQYAECADLLKRLIRLRPNDTDALFNLAVSQREAKDLTGAINAYRQLLQIDPTTWEAWANLAECLLQGGLTTDALGAARQATQLHDKAPAAWITQGDAQLALGNPADALDCFARAHALAPTPTSALRQGSALLALHRADDAVTAFNLATQADATRVAAHRGRGDAFSQLGRFYEAIDDYERVLDSAPDDDETLRKACICLQQLDRNQEIVRLCESVLTRRPQSVTAKIGRSWAQGKLVPLWHIPMMNEFPRNNAYAQGIEAAGLKNKCVFEIGSGSGLLSMLAARAGARTVVGCEAVPQIAEIAREVVAANGLSDTVSIVAKPSHAVQPGADLPERADALIHEIFSSELLSEHVLPAIEDAKARLLKPDAIIVPAAASVMCALVGGPLIGQYVSAGESFGFDLSAFNRVTPKKIPFYRQDLQPVLLSDDVEALHFDFQHDASFPETYRTLDIEVTQDGLCYGLIQWIRLDMQPGIRYQNHPATSAPIANWQHIVYKFDTPVTVSCGQTVTIEVAHDRQTLWLDLVRTR
ncbi:tetratricopeptide repeat protein [uncultured Propionivibrio sp.]|uniref:tetratricopeptide repeat protein n=1 Tax=uncultured Propionivibrio sp. TaxID=426737 RepID=UPI0029C05F22|nr:tetratricopeptide repeat protein [uncultured Propionivibrio sp.]